MTTELNFKKGVKLPSLVLEDSRALSKAKRNLNGISRDDMEETRGNIDIQEILEEPKVELLTMDYLDTILNKRKVDKHVKEELLKNINEMVVNLDSITGTHFRDTCISIIDIISGTEGRIRLKDYMKACLFVTFRTSGDTKVKAFTKTFPERVMRMQKEQQPMSNLYTYAEAYSRTKAVTDVQTKMLLPTHLMYHDIFHNAIKVAAEIMTDERVSPKVRVDAANTILQHTKQPEIKKAEVDIRINDSYELEQLKEVLHDLSKTQRQNILEGSYSVSDAIDETLYIEEK